jgi:diaminopimelate decarboxylase
MISQAARSVLGYFKIVNNHLTVGGRPLVYWAREYGTPLYIYDLSVVKKKVNLFREAIPADINLYYAVKANPYPPLLKAIVSLVDGFDVASAGELEAVLAAGGNLGSISFAGPGKRRFELRSALEKGIGSVNIESERELELILEEAENLSKIPRVSIRINPDFELHGAGMKMGGGPKQFGIDAEQVPGVISKIKQSAIDFRGFHIYAGSQNLHAEIIEEALERSLEVMWELAGRFAQSVSLLNLGGGFGIPYYEKDEELDIHQLGQGLEKLLRVYRTHFTNANFVIELGRYLTGECGIYLTRVLYKKTSRGKTYLVTDGGMNHHLAASGNFGQVLRKNFPIIVPDNVYGDDMETVDIVGPLCTPLDVLGARVRLPSAREGDLLAIMNSGAYGYSASPSRFLSHDPPQELCLGEVK